MPWRKLPHLALPLLLILLSTLLMTGCLYIPAPPATVSGTNVWPKVGSRYSFAPVRVHRITRDQVIALLGPGQCAQDPHQLTYTADVRAGYYYALCFFAGREEDHVVVTLTFDAAGTLIRAERRLNDWRPTVIQ